jgi:zinc transport system ATP-binding protein
VPLAVELRDLSFGYDGPPVLRGVDLAIEEGEFVAIAGPNGGGKTTLLRLALGLERPSTGQARLFGEPAREFSHRADLSYLAQRAQVGIDAPITVRELVRTGRTSRLGLFARWRPEDEDAVLDAIDRVGLTDRAHRSLRTLSGGQQQRALIAKSLSSRPKLLALDEPTAGVDADAQEALAGLLQQLHEELRVTILYVSHEFGAIEHFARRLVLVRGGIMFDGTPTELPRVWHDPAHVHL